MEAPHSDILYGLMPDAKAQTRLETLPHNPGPDSKWSCSSMGFLLHDGVVYVSNIGGLWTCVLKSCHDHPLAGHPGQTKTLKLVCWDYFWPKMHDDMTAFVKYCITCERAKACRHQPYGILQQLPIPEHLWHSLSMDFIEQLPPSFGYTSILVIVDCLIKQALFLPMTDEVTSEGMAQLYFQNIFLKHSVPTHITSDWGTEFVSHFFCSLGTLLGIRLHFTLGYHPQADGQTECINQTLEQYLHIHCNFQQDNWSHWLPIAEFSYNNTESVATGTTPFFANKGYHHPALPMYLDHLSTSHAAHQSVTNLSDVHACLHKNLAITQEPTQSSVDAVRTPVPLLMIGDRSSCVRNLSGRRALLGSLLTNTSVLLKSLELQDQHPSSFGFPTVCTMSIRYGMSPSSSQPMTTPLRGVPNHPHLHLKWKEKQSMKWPAFWTPSLTGDWRNPR